MKKILFKIVLIFLVLFNVTASFGQKKQIDKANKDFDQYSYIDAREIYLKVVEDGYESAEIFKKLGDTYYWNSDYDNAANWYQKLVQRYPGEIEPEYF